MTRNADHERIWAEWHRAASTSDQAALIALYADDAILESPLVPAILDDMPEGILRGRAAIKRFLDEGARRRPNPLVRWYRTDVWFSQGDTLIWEYPRQTDEGDQIDLVEVMEIREGKIQHHRIYWGWKGCTLIAPVLSRHSEE
ncbi:nuclear transport factor 2 family protein [Alloalcanivorax xenomutans]|uniref:nuclear transport factor 2 family protein n=1 Tax=Alloalcanivorax xenomutans TaxID=1094342 RepID=UPI0009B6568F|nr:nuclear transport factor 2 family protein [Alloalcanivorax xenomutans]ARB46988.1 hypothetical protein P40_17530 [Alloalcanivorax xenomutans]